MLVSDLDFVLSVDNGDCGLLLDWVASILNVRDFVASCKGRLAFTGPPFLFKLEFPEQYKHI